LHAGLAPQALATFENRKSIPGLLPMPALQFALRLEGGACLKRAPRFEANNWFEANN